MRHVLLIEDNEALRMAMKQYFDSVGYPTTAVGSRRAALRLIDLEFHAIITDWVNHGDICLCKFVRTVRAHPINGETPIVVSTAFQDVQPCAETQAVIQKPFGLAEAYQTLRSIARTRSTSLGRCIDPCVLAEVSS